MAAKLPNIVLIVLDTAGAKHMSLHGYERRTTPQLERLAEKATVYRRCYAPGSWTLPSHASLFTGLYPSEHGVDDSFDLESHLLAPNFQHIGNILRQTGYRTYGISCNGIVSPSYGNIQGFNEFLDYSGISFIPSRIKSQFSEELVEKIVNTRSIPKRIQLLLQYVWRYKDIHTFWDISLFFLTDRMRLGSLYNSAPYTIKTFRSAQELMAEHQRSDKETPFFFFINVIENHNNYNPPKHLRQFSRRSDHVGVRAIRLFSEDFAHLKARELPVWRDLYDDTIWFVDSLIGQLWDQMESLGLLDNTLFIVTSDHGEHFGEKGFVLHGLSLLNELIHVPLLIYYPDGIRPSGPDNRLVSLNDLFSTFLDLIGSPFPRPHQSFSLLSDEKRTSVSSMNLDVEASKMLLAKKLANYSRWPASLKFHKYALILEDNLKLLEDEDSQVCLYNLERDPDEEHDLFPSLPSPVQQDLLRLLAQDQEDTGYLRQVEMRKRGLLS